MKFDLPGGINNLLPGPLDGLRGPYATVADACAAVKNVVVEGRNFREGKIVDIGVEPNTIEHRWQGGFTDLNLLPYLDILDPVKPNLSKPIEGKTWNSSGLLADSTEFTALEKIPVSPGSTLAIQGTNGIPSQNSGRLFDSSDNYIGSISDLHYSVIEHGVRLTIPSLPAIAKVGLFFPSALAKTVIVQASDEVEGANSRKVKQKVLDLKGINLPEYIKTSKLFKSIPPNLSILIPGKYWNSTGELANSDVYTGLEKIPATFGKVFSISGISTIPAANSGRTFNAAGVVVGNITPSSFSLIDGGIRLIVPGDSTVKSIGLFFAVADSPKVIIQDSATVENESTIKINKGLLEKVRGSELQNDLKFQSFDDLFEALPSNLITNTFPGQIYSSSGALAVNTAFNAINKIVKGNNTYITIEGLSAGPISPNFGRNLRADGTVHSAIAATSLTAIDGGFRLALSNDPEVTQIALFFDVAISASLSNLIVRYGRELPKQKFKSDYVGVVKEKESQAIANKYYNRGVQPKTYLPVTTAPAFLFAGQSNQAGRIVLSELPAYWTAAGNKIPDALMMNSNDGSWHEYSALDYDVASGTSYFSYDLLLMKMIIDYQKSKSASNKVYGIKRAVGGTPISLNITNPSPSGYWNVDFEKVPTGKETLLSTLERRKVLADQSQNASLFDIRALIWHQGEADKDDEDNYYQNLKNLIWYVRGICKNPKLFVYLGGINSYSEQYSQVVEQAKKTLAAEDTFVKYITVENGYSYLKSDKLHFNYAGGLDIATKVYNQLIIDKILV